MERDAKGRFVKGNTEGHRFTSGGYAAECGKNGMEKREKNRTVAEVLRAQLMEKAGDGNLTKLEYLTLKAITTHAKGDMTMKDLREMQKVLGEDIKEMNINAGEGGSITITLASPKAVSGLQRAIANGAQPAAPEDE